MPNNKPDKKSYELRPSRDMRAAGARANSDLAEALLKIIAVGVAGGIATIAGAKKLGEEIQELQESAEEKMQAQREAYKQAVRKAAENEFEIEYENYKDAEEFNLTPSPLNAQPESVDLVLEASKKKEPAFDISFEGQEEAEDKVKEAMAEYDAAMDEAVYSE